MGYPDRRPSDGEIADAERFWSEAHGLSRESGLFVACFLGAFSRQFELETVLEAARLLDHDDVGAIRLVLCGDGELLEACRLTAKGNRLVILPGWVSWPKMWTLMRMSSVGLAPYRSTDNFTGNVPNKPIEYMSAGLPVISSLSGCLADLIAANECGVTYANRDAAELARTLSDLQSDSERLRRLSQSSRALFRSRYVASEVYGGLCAELERLARGSCQGG
jgi:glycosyltransferase involved in cell wall biosynthesis